MTVVGIKYGVHVLCFGITEPYTWFAIGKKLLANEKLKRWLTNPNRNFNETNEPRSALKNTTTYENLTCDNNKHRIFLKGH